ncbi:MAG: hypothetical protein Q4D48_03900 [Coriobacteriales bacterium]|nr:hypothetical protein [Coriobacteriales bacterium]
MGRGRKSGHDNGDERFSPLSLFVQDDGGYTTVAMALALLVSLTLVFSAASVEWALSRSAEVQEVADAAALAGSNCVAAFSTVYQVVDACVLSLGLSGMVVMGTGLVVAAIPFVQESSPGIIEAGRQLLEARRGFASSATTGLSKLEKVLPALIMANSASCVSANCRGGLSYVGCAIPFPQTSQTDYSYLETELDTTEMEESAEHLREATERREEALKRANEAKERAWRADCIDSPMCMRSRAETLAGLYGPVNPHYPTVDSWKFEYARLRSVNYYRTRIAIEGPENQWPEELSRSAARRAFYEYASEAVASGVCVEEEDHVMIDLPELPRTAAMARDTSLYTEVRWPCTEEESGRTLHSTLACPAAIGAYSGDASLLDLELGYVLRCDTCGMDMSVMGSVASASTNINNGYEHYWRIVVRASRDYVEAREDAKRAEQEMSDIAREGSSLFRQALDALSINRPNVLPAGAWGCVSVVYRKEGTSAPPELTASFIPGMALPRGAAISAATLAPDGGTDGGTVLGRAFDGLKEGWGAPVELVGSITELWGKMLVGYGSAYGTVTGAADTVLDGVGSLFGETVATWLRSKIGGFVDACGFKPADMRLRKPVLVRSQLVLDKAGLGGIGRVRSIVESLPASPEGIAQFCLQQVLGELGSGDFTVANLPIPGMGDISIPLTVDVSELVGAS